MSAASGSALILFLGGGGGGGVSVDGTAAEINSSAAALDRVRLLSLGEESGVSLGVEP